MEKDGKRKRRKFSAEYKAETVQLVQRSGESIGQLALGLGIRETALRRWSSRPRWKPDAVPRSIKPEKRHWC